MTSAMGNLQPADMERRQNNRRAILLRADVHVAGRQPLRGHALDVSSGGLGLLSPQAVDIDEQVTITIPFEVFGEMHSRTISGKVRYCSKQADNCFRVGLQFVNMNEQTAAFVADICR